MNLAFSGDVELNHESTTEGLLVQIREVRKRMAHDVTDTKTQRSSIDKAFAKLDDSLETTDQSIEKLRYEVYI